MYAAAPHQLMMLTIHAALKVTYREEDLRIYAAANFAIILGLGPTKPHLQAEEIHPYTTSSSHIFLQLTSFKQLTHQQKLVEIKPRGC